MSNWPSSIDGGTGTITPTGRTISLLSVSRPIMAPRVCAHALTGRDITRSVAVLGAGWRFRQARRIRRRLGTP